MLIEKHISQEGVRIKEEQEPWPNGSVDWSIVSSTKRLQAQFSSRAHT